MPPSVAEGKSLSSKHNLKARSRGRATGRRPVEACSMGETFEQAAIRELREETGILVDRVAPQV
ncbi:NUDIX hydrolase [Mesorhizobium sp. BR1-1-2]|uniref:NUDIX domain-containing protein n=1 Tax=unclassified Mesorhizobium TaxID=325217 RepID=UPI001CCAAE80|nr:NUDIX hydrolase [Mesorhizobium sp. BR1-1-2]